MASLRREGPTPGGGDYSVARGYDAAGLETDDLARASMVVIEEWTADGALVKRTRAGHFADSPADVRPGFDAPDSVGTANDPWNSELTKGTWDVRRHGDQEPVQTLDELYEALQWDLLPPEERRTALANLMTMPSFAAAPAGLKAEAYAEFA